MDLFSDSLEELFADLSRFSRDIEIVPGTPLASRPTETNYILQLPNPMDITKKFEQLELQYYQYKCFERIPQIAHLNVKHIQNKFKEILKNQGVCSLTSKISKSMDEVGDAATAVSIEQCLMTPFQMCMHDKLISKDYVIRMGDGLVARNESDKDKNCKPIMPQFLRGIVTGEKLRLCGAFTENTTFLD